MSEAWVVVDLAFGDSGKGTIVDWLVRTRGARLVVRWNGGAQAGHNVVTADGRHHTFSQLGAGSFVPGVRTHLSEDVVVHPTALLVEAGVFGGDILSRVTISAGTRVVTPFHQAAGRIRALASGHGTCGAGVGEAVRDALAHPDDAIRARDLAGDPRPKLRRLRERLRVPEVDDPRARRERAVLEDPGIESRWIDAVAPVRGLVVPDEALRFDGPVVLEGAHGVLLDEWRGFHPYTTWSTCTADAADALLARHRFDGEVRRVGVLRTYLTRHGPGPFPTETREIAFPEPHNSGDGWQGPFRLGWPDLVLARYALAVAGGIDGLAITHLDRLDSLDEWRAAARYRNCEIRPGAPRDLEHQEGLARALLCAEPELEPVPKRDYVEWIAGALGRDVWVTSHGPTAEEKRLTRTPSPPRPG